MHVPLSHAQSEKSGGVPSCRMELKSVDEYLDWAVPLSLPLTTISTTTSILRTQASISIESNVNTCLLDGYRIHWAWRTCYQDRVLSLRHKLDTLLCILLLAFGRRKEVI
jgi:hypothetical protein